MQNTTIAGDEEKNQISKYKTLTNILWDDLSTLQNDSGPAWGQEQNIRDKQSLVQASPSKGG